MRNSLIFIVVFLILTQSITALSGEENPVDPGKGSQTKLPLGPIFLTSFGLVTTAFGAGFGWQAYQEHEDYNKKEACGDSFSYPNATQSLADDIRAHTVAANVLLFGGAAIAIGGTIWLAISMKKKKKAVASSKTALLKPMVGVRELGLSVAF